jgi:hypothetical protein
MRWKYWNATFVAGCLSFAGMARAQTAPEPTPDIEEAEPLVLEGAPDVFAKPLPPTPAPEAPPPVFIQSGVAPPPNPAALPPMPAPPPGARFFAGGGGMARAEAQPDGSYRVQVVNSRSGRDVWIGVAVSPVSAALAHQLRLDEGTGVVVESVYPNTPAQKAGVQQYDVIERIDDQPVGGPEQFSAVVRSHRSGGKVTLAIIREGEPTDLTVKLSRRAPSTPDQPGAYPPGAPPQPQPPFGDQAGPKPRFFAPPQPPGAMPGQSYYRPDAPAFPRSPGERPWTPAPPPPGGMMPGQPYPEVPAAPGGAGQRFWGGGMAPPAGMMPGQPSPYAPAAPGGGGARFWGGAMPPPTGMPGQPDYRPSPRDSRGQGSSVRLDYENGQLTATVYAPDGRIVTKGPAEALMNQPGLPPDARRMLQRIRSDRSSAKALKPKKEKPRKDKDDDEQEDDDAQPRGR